jgi:hypothetical protein
VCEWRSMAQTQASLHKFLKWQPWKNGRYSLVVYEQMLVQYTTISVQILEEVKCQVTEDNKKQQRQ